MSASLLKAVASDRASLVLAQWPVRFGFPLSNAPNSFVRVQLAGHISTQLGNSRSWLSTRCLSGSTTRGADLIGREDQRKRVFSEEIDYLNAEIAGFVGELGDPDFDTPPGGCLSQRTDIQPAGGASRSVGTRTTPIGAPKSYGIGIASINVRLV